MSFLNAPGTLERPADALSLCGLARGKSAVVEHFECDRAEVCQLEAMGFRAGELVTMLMPGCPCAVAVGETRLMVSSDLLRGIRICPLD